MPTGSAYTSSASCGSSWRTWRRSRAWEHSTACGPASRRSETAASAALRPRPAQISGSRERSTSRCSGRRTLRSASGSSRCGSASPAHSRTTCSWVSRLTRRTPARSISTEQRPSSGFRSRRISPRATTRRSSSAAVAAAGSRSRTCSFLRWDDRHPRARGGGAARRERHRRALRQGRRGGDRDPRGSRRRRRPLPSLERHPRLRGRAAHCASRGRNPRLHRHRQPRLDTVARHVRRDASCDRGARAREGRPDALTAADALELATLGGARALGVDASRGSIVPGKQADLTVLSLADTAFVPWEDPVTGAVLGGSPHGVVATLVSGKPRYVKGGKTWLELIDAARSARGRLLHHAGPTS